MSNSLGRPIIPVGIISKRLKWRVRINDMFFAIRIPDCGVVKRNDSQPLVRIECLPDCEEAIDVAAKQFRLVCLMSTGGVIHTSGAKGITDQTRQLAHFPCVLRHPSNRGYETPLSAIEGIHIATKYFSIYGNSLKAL